MSARSGMCRQADQLVRRGARAGDPRVEEFHDQCRVAGCGCVCHAAAPRSVHAEIEEARRRLMVAAGVDPDRPASSSARERGFCRHNHRMDEANTGPRGECRACKREASRRCKAAKRGAVK